MAKSYFLTSKNGRVVPWCARKSLYPSKKEPRGWYPPPVWAEKLPVCLQRSQRCMVIPPASCLIKRPSCCEKGPLLWWVMRTQSSSGVLQNSIISHGVPFWPVIYVDLSPRVHKWKGGARRVCTSTTDSDSGSQWASWLRSRRPRLHPMGHTLYRC